MNRRPPRSTRTDTLFPYTTLFRSSRPGARIRLITRSSDVLREHAATYSADIMLSEPPIDPTSIEAQRYRLRGVAAHPVGPPRCDEEVITTESSEGRRVGKEWVRTCRCWWTPHQ